MPDRADGRRFSLEAARELLPTIKRLTAEAVRHSEEVSARMREVPEQHPEHAVLTARFQSIVSDWATRMEALDVEAKGLWLVDFDNGEGYYCWCYPEDTVAHFHGYDDGFAGRMKIV
jgi:hypothetical protein